jgi:hypothetical protein
MLLRTTDENTPTPIVNSSTSSGRWIAPDPTQREDDHQAAPERGEPGGEAQRNGVEPQHDEPHREAEQHRHRGEERVEAG